MYAFAGVSVVAKIFAIALKHLLLLKLTKQVKHQARKI
jgi:hypothetical protein